MIIKNPSQICQRVLLVAILLILVLTPALGSLTLIATLLALFIALPMIFVRRSWRDGGGKRWLWAILIAYCVYFTLCDVLLNGSLGASLEAMAPNIPLLAAALVAMALDPEEAAVSASRVGNLATLAVFATFGLALLLWLTQPGLSVLGYNLVDATLVNGRLSMLVGNPLPFAAAFMTLGFMALLGWHQRGSLERALALVAVATAVTTVAFWSQTRGPTLAALPLIALAVWYIRPRPAYAVATATCLLVAIALIIGLGGYGDRATQMVLRMGRGLLTVATGDEALEASTGYRLMMYRAALPAWQDSPVWGHGVSQQFAAVIPYLPEGSAFRYTHLHNTILTHAVSGGVLGVLALMAVLCSPFIVNRAKWPTLLVEGGCEVRDGRFLAALIFLALLGVGMTSLIMRQDVSTNFIGALLLTHLLIQTKPAARDDTAGISLGTKNSDRQETSMVKKY